MMYKLIKYTDNVRFTAKSNMIRNCYMNSIEELRNLKKSYENKDLIRFTNWIEINMILSDSGEPMIQIAPSLK